MPVEHTFSLAEPVKRDGPLHAIPGGFLANMQAVPLGLARRAIDEAIAVVTDKIVLPEGVAIREVPRVREAIADAQRQHRSAQAYASRSIDDAWTQLSSGAALSVDQRVDLILSRVEAFRMAQDVTAAMVRLVGTQAIYRPIVLFGLFGVIACHQRPRAMAEMADHCNAPHDAFDDAYWACRPLYDAAQQTARQYWTAVLQRLALPADAATIEWLRHADIDSWSRVDDDMVAHVQSLQDRAEVPCCPTSPPTSQTRSLKRNAGCTSSTSLPCPDTSGSSSLTPPHSAIASRVAG